MKHVGCRRDTPALALVILLGGGFVCNTNAVTRPAEVVIQGITGTASYLTGGTWLPLTKDMRLGQGATLKTGANSTVDLLLYASRTALRITPDSTLRLDELNEAPGLYTLVTETTLTLLRGSIAGTQRKLAAPSRFQVKFAGRVATIVGTEYYVRADGAVTVTSGTVVVRYNLPGNGGSIRVSVPAGSSFDPATGQVVPTTPAYLQDIVAHITTTSLNAQTFNVGGATVVVRPEQYVSPYLPPHGDNGVGNGEDPQPPGNPPINDGSGTGPGDPGNQGGATP
jgi:hypothetical protein